MTGIAVVEPARSIDKRLVLTGVLMLVLALGFWSGSRYPDLNRKAAVAGDIGVEGLSFDVVSSSQATDPFWQRTASNTLNWIETNKKGMTFGLVLAAVMLTMLSLMPRVSVNGAFGNSAIGIAIGAPMGLCVNCATPIATALHRGGTRLETSLSMLVSSPTMNVIVVSMLLSFFPWYIWATKFAGTALLALVGIPIFSRFVFRGEARRIPLDAAIDPQRASAAAGAAQAAGWGHALIWTLRSIIVNLWVVVRIAVPLMLLAGLLGSLLITVLPWNTFEDFALFKGGRLATLGTMAVMAIAATFLPVPMAFDVILCTILFDRGLPSHYVMVLLFTLGSFSVYPFLMLRRNVSLRVAATLFLATAAIGLASGVSVKLLEDWDIERQERLIAGTLHEGPAAPPPLAEPPDAMDDADLAVLLGLQPASDRGSAPEEAGVERKPFRPAAAGAGSALFARHDGAAFGLDVPAIFSPRKMLLRSAETNRPIASGDVHGDGWPDLLIGADHDAGGLLLFANVAGTRFVRQRVTLGALDRAMVQTAALIDLDGDSWLDIFFSTFAQGNYLVRNRQGRFTDPPVLISRDEKTLANAAGFGDIDRDGMLDIVIGNWTMSPQVSRGTPESARDHVLMARGGLRFDPAPPLEGSPGYTYSTLLTDFNEDGRLDLIVGNDFEPDNFFIGGGDGTFRRLLRADNLAPGTGLNTMSVTAADLDNDLRQELFLAEIAVGRNRGAMLARRRAPADVVAEIERPADRDALQRAIAWWPMMKRVRAAEDIRPVAGIEDPWLRHQFGCFATVQIAMRRVSPEWAALVPDSCGASEYLDRLFSDRYVPSQEDVSRRIPAFRDAQNTLLRPRGNGAFVNAASELNVGITDWTWNARFADVDNDGWQDLYAATGWARQDRWESNVYLRNMNGASFRNDTATSGLADYLPTSGYTYVDFDLDGDLDIVSVPVLGPVRVFVNNARGTQAVQIALRDSAGNSHGIGSRITIHYGPGGGLRQMREIHAGGGFVSFDEAVAHFGLGPHETVARVEIRWSTGETTFVEGPLPAGHRYVVRREARSR